MSQCGYPHAVEIIARLERHDATLCDIIIDLNHDSSGALFAFWKAIELTHSPVVSVRVVCRTRHASLIEAIVHALEHTKAPLRILVIDLSLSSSEVIQLIQATTCMHYLQWLNIGVSSDFSEIQVTTLLHAVELCTRERQAYNRVIERLMLTIGSYAARILRPMITRPSLRIYY